MQKGLHDGARAPRPLLIVFELKFPAGAPGDDLLEQLAKAATLWREPGKRIRHLPRHLLEMKDFEGLMVEAIDSIFIAPRVVNLVQELLQDRPLALQVREQHAVQPLSFLERQKHFGPQAYYIQLTSQRYGGYCSVVNASDLVTIDPDILGGTPVFKNTRVPIKALFDYLEDNYTLEEFLECFPSVSREMACQVLERSEGALLAPAAA